MALTRDFNDLLRQRAEKDPEFRRGLLDYAIEALVNDDLNTCKASLRTYVKATIGFEKLGRELGKHPKSLRGMLSESRNPLANNLSKIISYLYKREGIEIGLSFSKKKPVKI
ncbi:MAG: transcriptional regulator [Paracoccaceae bacterium]|nr:transcriptional regulator [Paracoccaceae bacterium]MDE2674610.1 transcriptional regulator [Paracoccaceae bacterium]